MANLKKFSEKVAARLGYVKDEDYCKDCKQVRHFKAKRLDDLEEALKGAPERLGGNTLVEEDGEVKLVTFTSKTQALELISKARKGELRLVF